MLKKEKWERYQCSCLDLVPYKYLCVWDDDWIDLGFVEFEWKRETGRKNMKPYDLYWNRINSLLIGKF